MKTRTTCEYCSRHKVSKMRSINFELSNARVAFNEFIHERESKPAADPSIMLFDQVILSKRNRGRTSIFSKSKTDFLSDSSDHLWRSAAANPPKGRFPGDYRAIVTRSRLIGFPRSMLNPH